MFFAEGVGKVAKVESLKVAALLVYRTNARSAKILTSFPRGKH